MTVRTRFAPSPTGALHIGGVRTALFSWLYARRHGGEYILRIEDTDRERSTDEAVQVILEAFDWLGLEVDEGPHFQSRRLERYRAVADEMITRSLAYHCYCSQEELAEMRAAQTARGEKPRYDGRCRDRTEPRAGVVPVVRFRNPEAGQVVVDDLVHGRVVFENSELDDLVILRSDGTPTFHFGVVVDDADMRITHVIRGDDHLLFDLSAVQRSPARFDQEKLNRLNQHYIKQAPASRLAAELAQRLRSMGIDPVDHRALEPLAEAFRERAKTLREMAERVRVYIVDDSTRRRSRRSICSRLRRRCWKRLVPGSTTSLRGTRSRRSASSRASPKTRMSGSARWHSRCVSL